MRRIWLALAISSLGCADEIPEDVSEQMDARAATDTAADTSATGPDLDGLLRTAPAGGHADWIRDIRLGLDSVTADAALDRGEALHRVQELYTRRFQPLRVFYGANGAINAGAGVTQAVEQTGAQIQELMRYLATDSAADEAIQDAVRSTQASLDSIEAAARSAGLSPEAPRDTLLTTSTN